MKWWLVATAALALMGCTRGSERWTLKDVRARAEVDFKCDRDRTVVVELGRNNYQAIGCGQSRTYVCRGGACSADSAVRTLPADAPLLGRRAELVRVIAKASEELRKWFDYCDVEASKRDEVPFLVEVDPQKGSVRTTPTESLDLGWKAAKCLLGSNAFGAGGLDSKHRYWFFFNPWRSEQAVLNQVPVASPAAQASAAPSPELLASAPRPSPEMTAPSPADPEFEQQVRAALDAQAADLFACTGEQRLVVEVIAAAARAPALALTGALAGSAEEACVRAAADLSTLPPVTREQRVIHLLRKDPLPAEQAGPKAESTQPE